MTAAERREKITAEIAAATGITEAMIERLVRGFYAKVRSDPALAPIFDARIQNWEPHLQQMCAFWSSVTLMSGRYHGTPMVKHMPLPVDALGVANANGVMPGVGERFWRHGRGAVPCTTEPTS